MISPIKNGMAHYLFCGVYIMKLDQTAPRLIRVHGVCTHDKISLECISIYAAADIISRQHFLDKSILAG